MWNRRQWLQQIGAGALGTSLAAGPGYAGQGAQARVQRGQPPELVGRSFELHIERLRLVVDGEEQWATVVNGHLPGPTLRWRQGESVRIRVVNHLEVPTSIHWHGILLPSAMDGVPGLSFEGIAPHSAFEYHFEVQQSGTYWYHAHSGFQEQTGLMGAIVIDAPESAAAGPVVHDLRRDQVVVLSDWAQEPPEQLLRKLRIHAHFDNHHLPTLPQLWRDVRTQGWRQAWAMRQMWLQMRMSPTDFSDLSAVTSLRYLINGCEAAQPCWLPTQAGQVKRLRLINASAQTIFDVRIPGLSLTVVAADGLAVEPVRVDELRLGVAETYDVLIEPDQMARVLVAQGIDRSGQIHALLAPAAQASVAVPPLDPVQWLEMQDMMGNPQSGVQVRHARTEYDWQTDMRVDQPRINLDDPGINLRHARRLGRRVLTYADLRPPAGGYEGLRPVVDREIELHLTGNMARYVWGMDGRPYAEARPLLLHAGERVRFKLVNDTMMTHPMHLHGMWSDLCAPDGSLQVRKHTLMLQPAQQICFEVTATPGRWAFHCHLLYHMMTGMFREVRVLDTPPPAQAAVTGHGHHD